VARRATIVLTIALVFASLLLAAVSVHSVQASDAYTIRDGDLYVYVPSNAAQQQPVQILVAMHGMGGDGPSFCQGLLAAADRNGWIVVAPTFKYQDYKNADLVLQDDVSFLPRLLEMIDSIPGRTGLQTRQKVLLYGHSRGAQAVHRFATYYPERTLAVAALSAGSYTLPLQTMMVNGQSQTLSLPFGVANMSRYLGHDFNADAFKQIVFRIEVGGTDANPADTPRAWDPYLGVTRVERARAYTKTLQNIGVQADLTVYPDTDHVVSSAMLNDSIAFLEGIVARNAKRYGSGLTRGALYYGNSLTTVATKP
jgi:S-formylglutathione hydrolase FrmB